MLSDLPCTSYSAAMKTIGEQAKKIRSKNAGPYWLTIDVFCGSEAVYLKMISTLTLSKVADIYQVPQDTLKRYELPTLNVIKFSFPRSTVQGSRFDRDMHGAQMSVLLSEYQL